MSESTLYVTYSVVPQVKAGQRRSESFASHTMASSFATPGTLADLEHSQPKAVQEFLNASPQKAIVVGNFNDVFESKRATKWPQLQKALETCAQKGATLLIIELGSLANNEVFTNLLLKATTPFHCLDQPFVNQTILEALSKHAEVQRKLHGKLIREGLKMTSAKSGNPNAAEVISKVNKPKIDTAIVFAFLLHPIIQDYRLKGHSQRQMVKSLNEEGFTAPEGGKWVLSQLQKVLDRVKLNQVATELKPALLALETDGHNAAEMAEHFNEKSIAPLKLSHWDESQIKKLLDRTKQIQEITFLNRFVLDLLPLLHEYRERQLSPVDILLELQQAGLPVKQAAVYIPGSKESSAKLTALAKDFLEFGGEKQTLELIFEGAAKHIPVYLKIVKGHIEQLSKVLELETHHHKTLNTAGLAEPVLQLITLFQQLNDDDIQLLEALAIEARNWSSELAEERALQNKDELIYS